MSDSSEILRHAPPPTPGEVINAIHDIPGDGSDSYPIENGSVATFWYGHAFELAGTQYYTGFVAETPEHYSEQDQELALAPSAQATLTHATFTRADAGAARAWAFDSAEFCIGRFGERERAAAIDPGRRAQSYTTPGGRFVLAVPTWELVAGVREDAFEVLAFDPALLADADATHWTYLGRIVAGQDNGAAVDEDGPVPLARSFGALSFEPQPGADLPLIHVAMSGTEVAGPGEVRTLGPADAVEYRYIESERQYQPSRQ